MRASDVQNTQFISKSIKPFSGQRFSKDVIQLMLCVNVLNLALSL